MKKRLLLLFSCILLLLTGCSGKDNTKGKYLLYYVSEDGNKTETYEYEPEAITETNLLNELLNMLKEPEEEKYVSPIPEGISILKYEWKENQLTVYFNELYNEMSKKEEVLCRSCIVRTVTQIANIQYVSFMVNELPLADDNGNPIGLMSKETFVDDQGSEIGNYQEVELTLYFANEKGDSLVEVTRDVYRNENISMEKLVLEQLIEGPREGEKAYPTIPTTTKILSVTAEEGVCYVNLNEGFLSQGVDVADVIPIYSIVNSLSEITGINKVQIAINGETSEDYKDNIPLDELFERDLDLLETK